MKERKTLFWPAMDVEFLEEFELAAGLADLERRAQADGLGNGGVGEVVEGAVAEEREHLADLGVARADVAGDEGVGGAQERIGIGGGRRLGGGVACASVAGAGFRGVRGDWVEGMVYWEGAAVWDSGEKSIFARGGGERAEETDRQQNRVEVGEPRSACSVCGEGAPVGGATSAGIPHTLNARPAEAAGAALAEMRPLATASPFFRTRTR